MRNGLNARTVTDEPGRGGNDYDDGGDLLFASIFLLANFSLFLALSAFENPLFLLLLLYPNSFWTNVT